VGGICFVFSDRLAEESLVCLVIFGCIGRYDLSQAELFGGGRVKYTGIAVRNLKDNRSYVII